LRGKKGPGQSDQMNVLRDPKQAHRGEKGTSHQQSLDAPIKPRNRGERDHILRKKRKAKKGSTVRAKIEEIIRNRGQELDTECN